MTSFMENYTYWWPILLAGILIGCVTAPIGCLILWQRKSFLGETLAHASLAGVALSLLFKVSPFWGILAVGFVLTYVLNESYGEQKLPRDAILAMVAQGGLALGLLLLSTMKGQRIDINAYLFGDLLTISWPEVGTCALLLLGLGIFLKLRFQGIVAFIIHEDLARIEDLISPRLPLQIAATITFSIAVLLPMVGVLLLTALMVIPAATARYCSQTPESMLLKSMVFSNGAMLGGIIVSFIFNLPTSPTMVIVSLSTFLITYLLKGL